MGRSNRLATASVTAANTGTSHIYAMDSMQKFVRLWISGLADSTVTVQATYDDGTTWADVEQYVVADSVNGSVQKVIEDFDPGMAYRLWVKAGDYGSDTVILRVGY